MPSGHHAIMRCCHHARRAQRPPFELSGTDYGLITSWYDEDADDDDDNDDDDDDDTMIMIIIIDDHDDGDDDHAMIMR